MHERGHASLQIVNSDVESLLYHFDSTQLDMRQVTDLLCVQVCYI